MLDSHANDNSHEMNCEDFGDFQTFDWLIFNRCAPKILAGYTGKANSLIRGYHVSLLGLMLCFVLCACIDSIEQTLLVLLAMSHVCFFKLYAEQRVSVLCYPATIKHAQENQPTPPHTPLTPRARPGELQSSMMIEEAQSIKSIDPQHSHTSTTIIDGGATTHMWGNEEDYEIGTLQTCRTPVRTASGIVIAKKKGTVSFFDHTTKKNVHLTHTLHIPGISHNLISESRFDRQGYIIYTKEGRL